MDGFLVSSREKCMFFVNLSGLLLGFLLVGATSGGAVSLINSYHPLLFSFCFAAVLFLFSMVFGLFVYSEISLLGSFAVYVLMSSSFLFLVMGLISLVCFVLLLVIGNGFFGFLWGFLFVNCYFWFFVLVLYFIFRVIRGRGIL